MANYLSHVSEKGLKPIVDPLLWARAIGVEIGPESKFREEPVAEATDIFLNYYQE